MFYRVTAFLLLVVMLFFAVPCPAGAVWDEQTVWGAWISPDWFFPGTRKYNEFDVRLTARKLMEELAAQGVNHIFLETFLRGYSIAAVPDKTNGLLQIPTDGPVLPGQLPLYRHLNWSIRVENGKPIDTLQIFIDEAAEKNIKVHAWVHAFYWKMDNRDIVLPWHTGMTVWNGLLVEYLDSQRRYFKTQGNVSSRTLDLLKECSDLFSRTYDDFELERILAKYKVNNNGKQLGSLITHIMDLGGAPPDFLLIGTKEEPFPSGKNRHLAAIYIDPGNEKAHRILIKALDSIVRSHPGLAGVHLDHVRYAVDYQGFPPELQKREWETVYFNQYNDDSMKTFYKYEEIIRKRRAVISDFVKDVTSHFSSNIAVSAAVLPSDPPVPGETVYFYSKNDFGGQDWYRWNVDFVVPMMYGYIPWRIRQTVKKWINDLTQIYGDEVPLRIFPGVSHIQKAKLGLLDRDTWVFFDLTLARDLRFEKKVSEDVMLPKGN
ncbi:MAG: hypothetical protein AB9903_30085 [Vulcanimicrobiota bacterium]